ncbi:esterase [Streptomyces sp. NBRC 110611]|uniref:trypsin-like serine protease n=1 Tax=Streptomyces sp. NBRC 110611 TaxID=1621259 RepID=UPI00082BA29B|nr:trypsin-like serine protease [Streptomyces sp. NBRC 110611]GAU65080.1 esterase [Streptomyces sp. NBRC 110611]
MSDVRPRTAWVTAVLAGGLAAAMLTGTPAQAAVGEAAKDGAHAFTAKLDVGTATRSCTGALVDPQWVVSAASCFADKPGQGHKISAGKPKLKTTATIGRTDLGSAKGAVAEVVALIPHADRDLVMARLAKPVAGIKPINLASSAPAKGDVLLATGYGRTKTNWIPDRLHVGAFTVDSVAATTLGISGNAKTGAAICKGDAGGPAFRETDGEAELVAINVRSWQGGCLGEEETRTDAVSTRVDDVADWIQQVRLSALVPDVTPVMTTGDFNGDGRSDIAAVTKDGNLHAFYGRTDGTFEYGRPLWTLDHAWKGMAKIIGGDFNGDGHADIAAVWSTGSLRLYTGDSKGTLAQNKRMWVDEKFNWKEMLHLARFKTDDSGRDGLLAVWGGGPRGALYAYETGPSGALNGKKRNMWRDATWQHMKKIATGDFNGDGRDDIVAITNVGGLSRYTRYDSTAGGGLSDGVPMWHDNGWGGTQILLAGDFDGDGKTDVGSLWSNQQRFNFYKSDGKGKLAEGKHAWPRIS